MKECTTIAVYLTEESIAEGLGDTLDKGSQSTDDLGDDFTGKSCESLGTSSSPIEALELIGEDDAMNFEALREGNLERITLNAARDWTEEGKANTAIV